MPRQRSARKLLKTAACLSTSGVLLGMSCGVEELQAVMVGLEAVAQQLNPGDGDINFGDWLLMELND